MGVSVYVPIVIRSLVEYFCTVVLLYCCTVVNVVFVSMGAPGRHVGNLKVRRFSDTYNFSYILSLVALISYLGLNPSYFSYVRINS